ncbi:MAG TPA: CoA-transferase [Syntrophorhabdaceae bacterium]|nr:CoA transferase subunit A [Syntrophorhabdaceae bacterium]MDI9560634.1 CoA-transferase [Pseudomonadota bacterium]MBP8699627.1 CoA transferase subunit A [Syntrophorhabdaceae bacterium]MBV6505205.1 Glutaconate CoA-transferase subunit A [Syntrophorhabdaceae bacterium]HNQ63522.1 CoA-transferase [Syntrophorhabdaceae bacterium]
MSMYPEIDDKLMDLEEAVSRFIKDGCQLAIGGFTIVRNPMAIAYEIIRKGIRDIHLVCHSHGQALDVLLGAGCVKRLEIAYGGNGRYAPTCIRFKKAIQQGELEFEDYSNYQMTLRFLAGALGMSFISTKSGLGSDLLNFEGFSKETRTQEKVANKKFAIMQNPFNEKDDKVVLLPALTPDVSIIHAQYVGEDGTVRIKGLTFADIEQAKSADVVIVTCEEIVPRSFIRLDPDQNTLPPFFVDAIVKIPYGAHPTGCFLYYDYDPKHLNLYKKIAGDDELFKQYLDEWVYGVPNHDAYLDKVGRETLFKIKANPIVGYAQGLDRK